MSSSTRINPPSYIIFNDVDFKYHSNEIIIVVTCTFGNARGSIIFSLLSLPMITFGLEVAIFPAEPTSDFLLPLILVLVVRFSRNIRLFETSRLVRPVQQGLFELSNFHHMHL
ncbi:hypothetical protein Sjap_024382 [Stephania japonica]|uniref:Transmembrane protein n=1 Tax=Stephania japonica TaxID=461633 RepID=A0AAP0EFG1_9MAGN